MHQGLLPDSTPLNVVDVMHFVRDHHTNPIHIWVIGLDVFKYQNSILIEAILQPGNKLNFTFVLTGLVPPPPNFNVEGVAAASFLFFLAGPWDERPNLEIRGAGDAGAIYRNVKLSLLPGG